MTILKKIWAFIRKWWMWIGAGIVLVALLIRRGVIMAGLSKLRRELEAKTKALEDIEYTRNVQVFKEDAAAHEARAAVVRTEISDLQGRIDAVTTEHTEVLEAIDAAKNWEELEKLRQAGNAR